MTNNIYQQFSEPFPPEMEKTLSKSGTRLTYIPVSEVINRLNKVVGVDMWSFHINACRRDEIDPDFVTAHVTLTVNIGETFVSRDGIGGQKIKRTKTGDIVDLGDEMKGAVSDALKKAAQTLGIGLYLARSDEAMDIEDAMESAPVTDPELDQKWDRFVSLVKNFDADKKTKLNEFWEKAGSGQPKPTKNTATHEALDLLIQQAVALSFDAKVVE